PRLHTPIGSCIAVGIFAGIPMIQFAGVAIIAIAATGMIYLSYLIGNLALLRARLRGWPRAKAPFALGRWGLPINLLAIAWGGGRRGRVRGTSGADHAVASLRQRADAVVIGGGVGGCAILYWLARLGRHGV